MADITSKQIRDGTVDMVDLSGPVQTKLNSAVSLTADQTFSGKNTFSKSVSVVSGYLSMQKTLAEYTQTFTQTTSALPTEWVAGGSFYAGIGVPIVVSGNKAINTNTSGNDGLRYINTAPAGDGTLQADLTNGGYLMWRYGTDGTNGSGYLFGIFGGGQVFVHRMDYGVADPGLYAGPSGRTSGTYKVVISGSTFQCYENNVLMATITDATYPTGFIGLSVEASASGSVDNFSWTPASAAVNTLAPFLDRGVLKLRDQTGAVTPIVDPTTMPNYSPASLGYIAWTGDVTGGATATTLTTGLPQYALARSNAYRPKEAGVTVACYVSTAGVTFTSALVAVYLLNTATMTWNLIGTSADQGAVFNSIGLKNIAVPLTADIPLGASLLIGVRVVATTMPAITTINSAVISKFGPVGSGSARSTRSATNAAMPASFTNAAYNAYTLATTLAFGVY